MCVCVCARARVCVCVCVCEYMYVHCRSALTQDTPVKAAKKRKSASKDESSSLLLKTGEVIELDRQQFKVGSVAAQGAMASLFFRS